LIIADTGFWVALLDKRDKYHVAAKTLALKLSEPLITTLPVTTEVCYLLQNRCNAKLASEFLLAQQDGLYSLFAIDEQHLSRCATLMMQYSNLPMDFADASLVVLAENLGHGRIVSTDKRDFGAYRWKNTHPFKNLLDIWG
jgi:uncharacterized protein